MIRKTLISVIVIFISISGFSQTQVEKDEAVNLTFKAIKLMDSGSYKESIKLLKKACKLDPNVYSYPYELGYAYYLKGDLKKSIKTFEKVVGMDSITDQCYQMLGNVYDINGNPEKAIETYNVGLQMFPNSGRLYLELGVMHISDPGKAIEFHEKGIEVEPSYPSNYYWASKIYCNSSTKMWGLLYGEIFMNIERGSKRTEEISKLLLEVYDSAIDFTSDTSTSVSFCGDLILDVEDFDKIPFSIMYEACSGFAIAGMKEVNLESVANMRKNFIDYYFNQGFELDYPNFVFDWHQYLSSLDYFESYNYWLLMQGKPEEFNEWYEINKDEFDDFIEWFIDNPMVVDEKCNFHRNDY